MALNPLINSEIEAATGKEHQDSAISTDNYSLKSFGEQQLGPYRCFVAEAVPNRKDKYLFEGRVWIDANDYSVVRIEGHPAKNSPSGSSAQTLCGSIRKLMVSGSQKRTRRLFRYGCNGRKS